MVFAYSQTTSKLVNEAANDSDLVSGQDRKIPPPLGTNQIAGFGRFRLLASLEKIKPVNKLNCRYIYILYMRLLFQSNFFFLRFEFSTRVFNLT